MSNDNYQQDNRPVLPLQQQRDQLLTPSEIGRFIKRLSEYDVTPQQPITDVQHDPTIIGDLHCTAGGVEDRYIPNAVYMRDRYICLRHPTCAKIEAKIDTRLGTSPKDILNYVSKLCSYPWITREYIRDFIKIAKQVSN